MFGQDDAMIAGLDVRELEDADWDAVADLVNMHDHQGLTGDLLRERHRNWETGDPRMWVVATNEAGEVMAYARSARRKSDPSGKFSTNLYVHPSVEGRGIGRSLYERNQLFAAENGADHLVVIVEDCADRGNAFAKQAGFYPIQHLFESKLNLETFDAAPFLMRKQELESEGYRFMSLIEAGDTIESWRRLHELDSETDVDTPGFENWGFRPFERYLHETRDSSIYMLGGVHVAEFEGEWVGQNIVTSHPTGEMHTDYSGVRREHRGKGLAQTLKALGAEFCRQCGAKVLVTNNDERNAAMLAVNAKFGFVVQPGFRIYRKDLNMAG